MIVFLQDSCDVCEPHDIHEPCEVDSISDDYLYTSGAATTPLFEGSPHSVLQSLVKYFTWFCEHPGISKEALSSVLATQHELLPLDNNMPNSYEAALRTIQPYLVKPMVYDVCPNDCIVFREEYKLHSTCPKCGSNRYTSKDSCIPVRHFTYLPIKPRLQRMFGNSNIAQVLQSHATLTYSELDYMRVYDIQQSLAWRGFYSENGIFKGDPRGLSLAICTDGVNPFSHNKVSYSMWPIMLSLLNLPRNIRYHFGSILLVGIIPSNGSQEPKSLNPYLEILIDELLELSNSTMYDAYQKAPFSCKIAILLHILDYPGISKVLSVVGSGGIQGCMFCDIKGTRNEDLKKTVYLQNRRFLDLRSSMRKDSERYCTCIARWLTCGYIII